MTIEGLKMTDELPRQTLEEMPLEKLGKIARGPLRFENPKAELGQALSAIKVLAKRAKTDPMAAEQLLGAIQKTDWWDTIEAAIEEFLKVADVDQLQRFARYLYDFFWQDGNYGGGLVTPRRLKRVADRLAELGTSVYDFFPAEDRKNLDYLLKELAVEAPSNK